MDLAITWWCTLAVGPLMLVVWIVWLWNELRYLTPLKLGSNGCKIPPGHMGLPFIGEMMSFLWYFKIICCPDDFIMSKRKRYGDGVGLYRTHLFGSPSIISCSPASNKFILQSDDLFTVRWPSLELVGSNSLIAVTGEDHTRLRNFVITAINHPESLKKIALTVQPEFISTLRSWAEKGRIVASVETKKVTLTNVCKMFVSLENGPLLDELDMYIRGLVEGIRSQPLNFPGTAYHHALKCRKKLTKMFSDILETRKQRGNDCSELVNDLMDGLRQIRDGEGKKLNDVEVVDNMVSLLVAGSESTAIATMWSLYYLFKFPNVLQRLREENMEILNQRKGEFITMEHISQMKYTSKVVEETIRTANIAPVIFRRVNKDVDYKGYRIPKDWTVAVWLRNLHTDPSNFDDPMTFNPDRWNESPKPGTYQVFGGGPRICPGNKLVRLELSIFLHYLTTGYRWELIKPDAKITYLPHPKPVDGAEMTFRAL